MKRKIKILSVEFYFHHIDSNNKLLLDNDYEIDFFVSTEQFISEKLNFDLVLFNINSKIKIDDFMWYFVKKNKIPIIFTYCANTPEEKILKTNNIDSSGYLPNDVNFSVFDLTIKKVFKQLNEPINEVEITNKLEKLNRIYIVLLQVATLYLEKSHANDSQKIQESLEFIGLFVNADRSYIFIYDWENNITSNTFEWCGEGISSEIENLQNISCNLIPDWVNSHKRGERLVIENVDSLDDNNELKKILAPQFIKSLITVPILNDDECIGFVGFDYVNNYCETSYTEYEILSTYSKILNGLETRKRFERELISLNANLEEKIKQKTKELLKKEKKHSNELRQNIKDLEEILFTISHKLRQPVANILSVSQLFDLSFNSIEEIHELVGVIKKSTELVDTYVHELTQLAHEKRHKKSSN